jgi:hypothetical protein
MNVSDYLQLLTKALLHLRIAYVYLKMILVPSAKNIISISTATGNERNYVPNVLKEASAY